MNQTTTKKRGRPNINVQWPENEFTLNSLFEQLRTDGVKMSKVALQLKANKAIKNNEISVIGKKEKAKGGVGRKQRIFKKVVKVA